MTRGRFDHDYLLRETRNQDENYVGYIKMKIPPFQRKSNPEAYLKWEKKLDFMFDCHNYYEIRRVKLAVVAFVDYAINWWD